MINEEKWSVLEILSHNTKAKLKGELYPTGYHNCPLLTL